MMDSLAMMDLNLLAIIVGILFVAASLLFGWMLFYFVRSRQEDDSRVRAGSALGSTASPPAGNEKTQEGRGRVENELLAGGQQSTLSEVAHRASAPSGEVLRLLRDRVTGALVVEVEGKQYRALSEIKDEGVGRQVLQAVASLVRFTGVLQVQVQGETSQPPSTLPVEPRPVDAPPRSPTAVLEQAPPVPRTPAPPSVEREFLQSLVQPERPKEEAEKPSLSPIEFFRRSFTARRKAKATSDVPSPRSFVEEIEDLLQRFLRTYPSVIGKEIHVGVGQGGGIRIQVENEFFDRPDDIPDPEIRGILKAAIQEWEKSHP
jgi:hypothetical protein